MSIRNQKPQGMAVLLVLVQVFVLALFVAALGSMAIKNLRATSEKSWERQARFAAYAGIQQALADLDADSEVQILTPAEFDLGEAGNLRYSLEIHNNVASDDGSAILSPDNTWIPPGAAWVRSRGYLGEVGSYQSSGLIALVARARPVFDHAIFAEDSIRLLNGSRVDSYSSAAGFASSQSHPGAPQNAAHLASNTSTSGAIELASGTWVDGNVYSGLGSNPGAVILGSSQGDKLQLDEDKDVFRFRSALPVSNVGFEIPWLNANGTSWVFPWETDPEQAGGNPSLPRQASYGTFRIRTNNPDWVRATNIFSGEYFVSQNLVFESDSGTFDNVDPNSPPDRTRIDVHANDEFPAVIYVAGDVTLNHVRLNTREHNGNSPRPRRLQIYMLEENRTFRMTGSEAHVLVAGKGINVQIDGGSELFGAVIGGRVTLDNAQIHYDTTLAGIPQNGRTAWDILAIKEASGAETTQLVGNPAQAPPKPPAISEVALDPVQGTRGGGNAALTPQEDAEQFTDFRDIIPREEIEENWDPGPGPECGTCAGAGVPGGILCTEPGCPGHGPCGECNLITPPCSEAPCGTCGGAGGGPGGLACGEPGCPGHGPCGECNEASPACGVCTTCGGSGPENCAMPGCKVLHSCGECGTLAAQPCNNPGGACGTCGGAGGGTGGPTCGEMGCPGHMPCTECATTSPACSGPAGCPECQAVQGHNFPCSVGSCGWGTWECINGPGCMGQCIIP